MENARTIFTVKIVKERGELLFNEHNEKKGFVGEESYDYGEDDTDSRFSESFQRDHNTPAPDYSEAKNILRITTDHWPRNTERGFMFGRNEGLCDILLDHPNISEQQFAIRPLWHHGTMVLKNHSRQGTIVNFHVLGDKKKMKSQLVLPQRESVAVRLADGSEILIQTYDKPADWEIYCANVLKQPQNLVSLDLDPPETTNQTNRAAVYVRDRLLGKGSNAQVFRVINKFTGKPYAMKLYNKPRRPPQEPHILERLNNQFIVRYVSYIWPANQRAQLIMELVNGPNLQEVLDQGNMHYSPLTIYEAREILSQLLRAVSYLHSQCITHRDLKPANIFIQTRYPIHIKLGDFGESSDAEVMKTYCGTPVYAAPEIVNRGGMYTNMADIFSIGVIALQLLYGLPNVLPNLGNEQQRKKMSNVLLDWKDSLLNSCEQEEVPLSLDFISKLLQEDPKRRPSAVKILSHSFFSAPLDDFPAPRAATVPNLPTQIYNPLEPTSPTLPTFFAEPRHQSSLNLDRYSAWERQCEEYNADLPDTLPWDNDYHPSSPHVPDTHARAPGEAEFQDAEAEELPDSASEARPIDPQSTSALHTQRRSTSPSSISNRDRCHNAHRKRDSNHLSAPGPIYNFIPLLGQGSQSALSHISTRDVQSGDGLFYVVIRRWRVSMDALDYRVNANQILLAAGLEERERSGYRDLFRRLKLVSKRVGSRSSWIPFKHGYFLSQTLGLGDELRPLFSCAKGPCPKSEENYLTYPLQRRRPVNTLKKRQPQEGLLTGQQERKHALPDPVDPGDIDYMPGEGDEQDGYYGDDGEPAGDTGFGPLDLTALVGGNVDIEAIDWMDLPGSMATPLALRSFAEDPAAEVIPPSEKKRRKNMKLPDGFYTVAHNQQPITYNLRDRTVNATRLIGAFGIHRSQLPAFWSKYPEITRTQRTGGNSVVQGTYIQLEDATIICNHFGLSLEPIKLIMANFDNWR
ncbi:kinase-like domain-containing protein [Podospora didyma]|uniref:Kinase-like domain-containing protein n=1 Tax=Podospora didyma TaxID=330526 RepID=A0AAE0N167_9PEZI|nr:kinase-like domain-containing protein [Podospora didyma]